MASRFVVEVSMPPGLDSDTATRQLSQAFRVDSSKVTSLLGRLPAVVTRPVSEQEAKTVAQRFTQAGLQAAVRPHGGAPSPAAAPNAGAAQAGAAAASSGAGAGAAVAEAPAVASADVVPDAAPKRKAKAAKAKRPKRQKRARKAKAADGQEGAKRRGGSIRSKLLSVAIIPTVLTILGALTVIWLTARPALYEQLLESARNPAIATAASLSAVLEEGSGDSSDYLELLQTILVARQAFSRQNISFIVATDPQGNPLSGYFAGGESLTQQGGLELAVQEQAQLAVTRHLQGTGGETGTVSSSIPGADGSRIEIVAQPLLKNGEAFGAVVVGVTDAAVTQQVNTMLLYIFLFSLIPIALAILIAFVRARALTRNVLYLTGKADQISRGDLEDGVELKSNDELENLSEALERMRVSMKEALDRLRRRRI